MTRSLLITGASTGFGAEVALGMAARGWRVFASMRNPAKAAALVDRARAGGNEIMPVTIDVTDQRSIETGVAEVFAQTGGKLDALLNNAGYSVIAPFEEMSDADARAQMETNFFGTLAVTRAILPAMREARRGRIVTVSSNAVNAPHPMLSLYAASKWALEGWAEGLAMEVAPFGIEVAVVQPGAHRTPFASNVQYAVAPDSAYASWMEAAGPSLSQLDAWSRDPALATGPIIDLLTAPDIVFRTALGEDSQVFAALKGATPFELRAMMLRAITGAPAPDAFTGKQASARTDDRPVASEIVARVARGISEDPAAAEVLARTFGL